jgi:hypothetical protein
MPQMQAHDDMYALFEKPLMTQHGHGTSHEDGKVG